MKVYLVIPGRTDWCTLASAHPGGLLTAKCGTRANYSPVAIATKISFDQQCEACRSDGESEAA